MSDGMVGGRARPRTRWAAATALVGLVAAAGALAPVRPAGAAGAAGSGAAAAGAGEPARAAAFAAAVPAPAADWLTVMNWYRAASGLATVVDEPAWTAGAAKHIVYMQNTPTSYYVGQYASAHTENPASPWYTPDGAAAAGSSNIGGGSTDREAIDGWMAAPFHAIGILRPNITRSAFARAGGIALLDVVRGSVYPAPPQPLTLFPGPSSTTWVTTGSGESPDPREGCAGASSLRGLPIIALLTTPPPAGTTATLTRPDGSTLTEGVDLCVQTPSTFHSSDAIYGSTGESLITGTNGVFVIPKAPLVDGAYTVRIVRPGAADVVWSFNVDATPSVSGVTAPGAPTNVAVASATPTAVTVRWDPPASNGGAPLTGYHVSVGGVSVDVGAGATSATVSGLAAGTTYVASVQAVNAAGGGIAGTVTVTTPPAGGCAGTLTAAVTGPAGAGATSRLVPLPPVRILDTRDQRAPVCAGAAITLTVAGHGGVPASGATAVVLNVTATEASGAGFVTVWPAGRPRPTASNLNLMAIGQTRPNLVIVPLGDGGAVNLFSQSGAHLLADVAGYFTPSGPTSAGRLEPLDPARVLDTREPADRTGGAPVAAGATLTLPVVGRGGVPFAGVAAVVLNLTGVGAAGGGYVTAWPSGTARPVVSNLNLAGTGDVAANLAVVPVGGNGAVDLFTLAASHLVVDVVGYVTDANAPSAGRGLFVPLTPDRVFDTRNPGESGRVGAGGTLTVVPGGVAGVPASGVGAVALNVTATEAAAGFVTVWPAGAPRPTASTLNLASGDTRPNATLMRLGAGGAVSLFSQSGAHLLADASGWFTA